MRSDHEQLIRVARRVLERNQGVAHLQRFLEAGLSRKDVGHLRHLGVLMRPRIGWYVDPRLPPDAIEAVRVGGALGCTSALASWGVVVPEHRAHRLEVSVVPGVGRLRHSDSTLRALADSEPDVRWHWERRADPVGGWRVSLVDALLQAASCIEWRWLVAAIDSARCTAQHRALLPEPEVGRLRALLPGHLSSAVDRSDPRSETSGETFVRLGCEDAGIPFVPNQWVTSGYKPDGLVGGWLPIEVDGLDTHATRDAVERDHEKDATIAQFGMHPLRFTQNKAVRETDWVVETIRRVWVRGSPFPGRHAAG